MNDRTEFLKELYAWTDIELLPKAMAIAEKAHAGQFRDEGSPYIEHIKGVIKILQNEFDVQSDTVLSVAAMHDVLEDSDMFTYEDINNMFGKPIADGVLLLSKSDGQDIAEYMRAIKDAPGMSWLILVKLADRIHNLRSLKLTKNPDKIKRKCQETREHFLKYSSLFPAAHKLILSELAKLEVDNE
jgi:GTP pyrophosphokinase